MRLAGKVALVTGAAQGIGVEYARCLAREGAKVVVTDILDPAGVVASIVASGGIAVGKHADVSRLSDCREAVAQAVADFGGLDILVANAAIFSSLQRKKFTEISENEWDRVMAVNTKGVFFSAQAAVPEMTKRGGGKIVTISSASVPAGSPYLLHYVSSKGAIDAMTRGLARELGEFGIAVNALAPGFTMSEVIEAQKEVLAPNLAAQRNARCFKRDQFPEDLLGALLFLVSSDSDFMTGQSVIVDGGVSMR